MEHWRRQIHHPRMLIFSQSDPPLQNIQGNQSYEVRRWPLQILLERFKPSYFFLFFFVSCFLAKSFKCSIFQTSNFLFKLFTVVKRRGLIFFLSNHLSNKMFRSRADYPKIEQYYHDPMVSSLRTTHEMYMHFYFTIDFLPEDVLCSIYEKRYLRTALLLWAH